MNSKYQTNPIIVVLLKTFRRFWHALYCTVDGNFKASLKPKRRNDEEEPLTKGGGYFVNEDGFKAYSKYLPPIKPEVRTSLRLVMMVTSYSCPANDV